MSILEDIFASKKIEVAARRKNISQADIEARIVDVPKPPDFLQAICSPNRPRPRLIAEVKHRSPSKGILREDFNPVELAQIYAKNGAAAISVLTDQKYFGGSLEDLGSIARAFGTLNKHSGNLLSSAPPLLRKDFIFDFYQLLEARSRGASAILLIARMLDKNTLQGLLKEAEALGMAGLVEVHNRKELEEALEIGSKLVGINNRNLDTFEVSLKTTLDLVQHIPTGITVVSESGIHNSSDLNKLRDSGVEAILVGEGIVSSEDPGEQVRLFSGMEKRVLKRQDRGLNDS